MRRRRGFSFEVPEFGLFRVPGFNPEHLEQSSPGPPRFLLNSISSTEKNLADRTQTLAMKHDITVQMGMDVRAVGTDMLDNSVRLLELKASWGYVAVGDEVQTVAIANPGV